MTVIEETLGMSKAGDASPDERVRRLTAWHLLMGRPELGAIAGAILVFGLFGVFAGDSGMFAIDGVMNWAQVAAYLGILAVGACLLMMGGEFDLSMGSMIGFAGVMVAAPVMYLDWPAWVAVIFAFAGAMALGGSTATWWCARSCLRSSSPWPSCSSCAGSRWCCPRISPTAPSFQASATAWRMIRIVRTLFVGSTGAWIFHSLASLGWIEVLAGGEPVVNGIPKVILWWVALGAIAAFVLARTRAGNWIRTVGGDANAAKNVGVPVRRVKISLFVFTAFCACLFGVLQVADVGSAAADRGLQKEFEAIIAVVIGGTLLTGGFGSVVGACFGALIFGVVQIGISFTNINSDWYRVFLGAMLLLAVLFNHYIRGRAAAGK